MTILASSSKRGSGIGTTPVFGSIVQNGKLAASMPALVSALKRVDLPTFGSPTIPHLNPILFVTFLSINVLNIRGNYILNHAIYANVLIDVLVIDLYQMLISVLTCYFA